MLYFDSFFWGGGGGSKMTAPLFACDSVYVVLQPKTHLRALYVALAQVVRTRIALIESE